CSSGAQDTPAHEVLYGGRSAPTADQARNHPDRVAEQPATFAGASGSLAAAAIGAGGDERHAGGGAQPGGRTMRGDAQGDGAMLAGQRARTVGCSWYQPGVRAGPGGSQLSLLLRRQRRDIAGELGGRTANQDQALVLRPALDAQHALHAATTAGIAAETETRFGRIGDDAALPQIVLQSACLHRL